MTQRTLRIEECPTCSVADCRMPASHQMGFHFPGHPAGTPDAPLEIMVGLYLCEYHAEHPIQTPRELFDHFGHAPVIACLAMMGVAAPDFDGACYRFKPLPPLSREAAN